MTPCKKNLSNTCTLLNEQGGLLTHCAKKCTESSGKWNQQACAVTNSEFTTSNTNAAHNNQAKTLERRSTGGRGRWQVHTPEQVIDDKLWEKTELCKTWRKRFRPRSGRPRYAVVRQAHESEQTAFIPKCRWISPQKRDGEIVTLFGKKRTVRPLASSGQARVSDSDSKECHE